MATVDPAQFFFAIKLLITGIQRGHPAAWKPFTEGRFISRGVFFKETNAFDLNNGCFLSGGCHRADLRVYIGGGG